MNAQPIVMTYCQHGERFAVDAAGCVSRPAIRMGASGAWRITGAVTAQLAPLYHSFPALCRALADGTAPRNLRLTDYDHGARRMQGAALDDIRLIPVIGHGHDTIALVERLDAERRARESEAAESARLAALERCKRRRVAWQSPELGITLYRAARGKFALVDNGAVQEDLEPSAAAVALGWSIMEGVGA
jgi:hypothetical protein